MHSYLIVGLGNVGEAYHHTRHNIGFEVLDALAEEADLSFSSGRYADLASLKVKNRLLWLIKPTTFMNLSGKAVNYWLQEKRIPLERLLVIVDELALPLGTLRLKLKGSDGGHNGLKDINRTLGRQDYPRLRIGIGGDYPRGQQVDYVLGQWSAEERSLLKEPLERATQAVKSFALAGPQITMSQFNG
jgi:peptidyl-tRNA hydrolase